MIQLAEAVARVTQCQVGTKVEIVTGPRVIVKPGFVKLSFVKFEKEYVDTKTLVHALRNQTRGGRSFDSQDFEKPTFFLTLSCLQFLEQVIRLICACVPASGIASKKIITQVQEFTALTKGMFDAIPLPGQTMPSASEAAYYSAKADFQAVRRELRKSGDSTKPRVSSKAYKGKVFQKKHFITMMAFAKQLAQVCRAMYCKTPEVRPQWLPSTWDWKTTIPSIEYLCVQTTETARPVDTQRIDEKKRLYDAFLALDKEGKVSSYINNAALKKQEVPHAIVLYTVLLETILAMKKKWPISETLAEVQRKLRRLDDDKCEQYQRKSRDGVSYVYDKLASFWSRDCYQEVYKKVKTSKNSGNISDQTSCKRFCLALCRYALAATPKRASRTPELVSLMERVNTVA